MIGSARIRALGALVALALLAAFAAQRAPSAMAAESPPGYFAETGYRVCDAKFYDYFNARGNIRTFGYPVSRCFTLDGFTVQVFQRRVLQLGGDGNVNQLNLLDAQFLPYTNFNGARFPAQDNALVASAPAPGSPGYAQAILDFVRANAPDAVGGRRTGYYQTFQASVTMAEAYPRGGGNAGLLAGIHLEMWGAPTSRPAADPNNANFVYLRFQRGIMHHDAATGATQGILLGDYFKAVLTGQNLPPDLADQAKDNRYLRKYDNSQPDGLRPGSGLSGTNLKDAFEPEPAAAAPAERTAPGGTATGGSGGAGSRTGALTLKATYQSIGVYASFEGDANGDNGATLEYRRVGESAWRRGMDMTPDRRASVGGGANPFRNQWRGSVLMAQPGADYEVRVTWTDPDGVGGANPVTATVRTRSDTTPAAGSTYYVAPSGADSNPGTAAAPWRTLDRAAGAVNPGDTVLVRAGSYGPVRLSRSGEAANWVLFKGYPGERPVVTGGDGAVLVGITGSYVRFGGFELAGGRWGVEVGGNAHDVVVEGNLIRGQAAADKEGAAVQIGDTFSTQNPVRDVTVQDNDVRADTLPESENDVIVVKAASGGHVIRRNRIVFSYPGGNVHGTDCIGGLPNFARHGGFYADTDVNDNYCDGATDEGIEIDGGNANVRVWGNTITRANGGFSTTPVLYGPVYVFRNVVYGLQDHWVGSCYMVKDGEGGTGAVYFYQNTLDSPAGPPCRNTTRSFAKNGGGGAQRNVVIKNNVIHMWGRLYETGAKTADYNLNYVEPASGDKTAELDGASYWGFADFQRGSGQEAHGLWGTAAFVNAAGGDFRLAPGSAGVDRGVVLPGFNDADSAWPFRGAGPDIGAFES